MSAFGLQGPQGQAQMSAFGLQGPRAGPQTPAWDPCEFQVGIHLGPFLDPPRSELEPTWVSEMSSTWDEVKIHTKIQVEIHLGFGLRSMQDPG